MTNKNIAAVVVTFNRLGELKKNIESLLEQTQKLDMIYIINNSSTDGTFGYISELEKNHSNITGCHLDKNLGGAGGFSYGLKLAFNCGYQWIWLMDDDGRPSNLDTLKALYEKAEHNRAIHNGLALYNCNVLHDGENLSFSIGNPHTTLTKQNESYPQGIIENGACVFNGSLINRSVIEKIGVIRAEYFIRGDEVEYLLRCKNKGVYVATVINSLYFHPRTEYIILKAFGKKFSYEIMPIWKQFFLIRNYAATYVSTARGKQRKVIIKQVALAFLGIIKYHKNVKRFFIMIFAIVQGIIGRFDNRFR